LSVEALGSVNACELSRFFFECWVTSMPATITPTISTTIEANPNAGVRKNSLFRPGGGPLPIRSAGSSGSPTASPGRAA
jgi:hypothetical protein